MEMLGQVHSLTQLLLQAASTLREREFPATATSNTFQSHRSSPQRRWKSEQHHDADRYGSGSESDSPSYLPIRRRKTKPYQRTPTTTTKVTMAHTGAPFDIPSSPDDDDELEMGGGSKLRGPAQHNEVEKRRRAFLSSCYTELKELLPTCMGVKASNVVILGSAAVYVAELDITETELHRMVQAAQHRRDTLQAQVVTLTRQNTQVEEIQPEQEEDIAAVPQRAWSPPHVGDSSDEASMDDEASFHVPDLSTSAVDDKIMATPSLGEAASLITTPKAPLKPSFGFEHAPERLGGELLMLLAAASAKREKSPERDMHSPSGPTDCGMLSSGFAESDGSNNSRRNSRKPARFL